VEILRDLDENLDLGVFDYGEFKNSVGFEIRAKSGLQTGSKHIQKKYDRIDVKIGTRGFSDMEDSKIASVLLSA
jgi:hypothetical protein